jgi:hypothetical protein
VIFPKENSHFFPFPSFFPFHFISFLLLLLFLFFLFPFQGGLKAAILADLARFIHRDARLPVMLRRMTESGAGVFLVTNSDYKYSHGMEIKDERRKRHALAVSLFKARGKGSVVIS